MNQNLKNTALTPTAQRAAAFSFIGSHTLKAAQVSKLREGNAPHHRRDASSALTTASAQSDTLQISQEQQIRTIDNENALALMPEIAWACRVLVSSILSPKDMTKRDLLYTMDLDWISPGVKSYILEEIKQEMEATYDYANSLYPIFADALFNKGSHPRLVLPEAAVDSVINKGEVLSMESISSIFHKTSGQLKRRGYFGDFPKAPRSAVTINMESFERANGSTVDSTPDEAVYFKTTDDNGKEVYEPHEFLSITDNFDAIKLPHYLEAIAAAKRSDIGGMPEADFGDFDFAIPSEAEESNESFTKTPDRASHSKLTKDEFRAAVYKSAPGNMVTHLRIPGRSELKRRSVGRPLVASPPPESVIVICKPGNPREHLGYGLLIDDHGNFLSMYGSEQLIGRAQTMFNAMNTTNAQGRDAASSSVISKAARNLTGGNNVTTFREGGKIVEQLMEDNLIPRLMNGAFPTGAEIADSSDLYMLMWARTLCSMRTRMVFVPAEMMTYFAFDYHHNGMGKSLLDANKILISIRAGLLLTRMTGEIRNSIPLTKVTMKIDEQDADWEKTWAEGYDAISKTRQPQYPLSTLAVNDIMDWVNRAGFIFAFEGHPRMPDTGFDFEKFTHENPLPDQEFYDNLGKQLYMGFGIPPELMDSTYDPEFAIAVASRNIMFTQTILEYQKLAAGLMTADHHRLILSDGVLLNKIAGLVKAKWGDIVSRLPEEDRARIKESPKRFALDLIERIVLAIRVGLPSPDGTTLENQAEQVTQFENLLDTLLKYFVSEDVVSSDIAPELAQKIGSMEGTVKAALMRKWLADNNIMPQLFDISATDNEGKPAFDLLALTEDHTRGLAANFMSFAKSMIPVDTAVGEDSKTMKLGDENTGSGGFGGGGGGGGDSGGGGEDGGLDSFDLDMPDFGDMGDMGDEGGDSGEGGEGGDNTGDGSGDNA